jgi:hypothetical protein
VFGGFAASDIHFAAQLANYRVQPDLVVKCRVGIVKTKIMGFAVLMHEATVGHAQRNLLEKLGKKIPDGELREDGRRVNGGQTRPRMTRQSKVVNGLLTAGESYKIDIPHFCALPHIGYRTSPCRGAPTRLAL